MHSTWELPHFYSMEMLRDSVIRVFSLSLSFIDDFWNIFFYFFPPIPSEEFLLIFPTSLSYCYLRMKMEMKKLLISWKVHFHSTSHSTGGAEIERKSIPFETIAIFRDRRGSELFFSSSFRLSPPYSRFEVAQTRNATSYDGVFCIIVRETGLPVTGDNTYTLLRLLCR